MFQHSPLYAMAYRYIPVSAVFYQIFITYNEHVEGRQFLLRHTNKQYG